LLETPLGIIRTKVWKLKLDPHRNYRYSINGDERIIYILKFFIGRRATERIDLGFEPTLQPPSL